MSNMFMNIVKDAVPLTWKTISKFFKFRSKVKKFKKTIHGGSPSFGVLWSFADFIKYAERIFFYDNSKNSNFGLFSSDSYEPGHNGFRIIDNISKEYIITVKLFTDTQKVGIDIESQKGNKIKQNYTFINGEWTEDPDDYDILLVDRVISIINLNMICLLDMCIYKRIKDQYKYHILPKFEEVHKF